MSYAHDIDNEDPLFQFDSYESVKPSNHLEVPAREPQSPPSCSTPPAARCSCLNPSLAPSWYQEDSPPDVMWDTTGSDVKGKGISPPLLIQTQGVFDAHTTDTLEELFFMSPGSSSSSARIYEQIRDFSSYPPAPALPPLNASTPTLPDRDDAPEDAPDSDTAAAGSVAKGKARELPPTLPPLSFYPTELSYEGTSWPSFDSSSSPGPGPSSYGSVLTSGDLEPAASSAPRVDRASASPELSDQPAAALQRMPSRRRSLSNLSIRSTRSVSALSLSKVKVKLPGSSKGSGMLARKLFKKRGSPPQSPSASSDGADTVVDLDYGCIGVGEGSCLLPWARDSRPRISPLPTPTLETGTTDFPLYFAGRPDTLLRTKGRSYSSPLPLPSTALDLVSAEPADIYKPVPVVRPCYFDTFLPRELKLQVLAALVGLHQWEHEANVREGRWSFLKAASLKNKWVGRDRGIRELFKLSRVSRSWQTLVLDGQLWAKLDLRSFPKLRPAILARLSETAGAFIREIDFTGHTELSSAVLQDITSHLCAPSGDTDTFTRLTSVNLRGCTNLTTHSLHHLLIRSPSLLELCLKGLTAVTDTTCDIIASWCPKLVSLDLSRCPNMTGEGMLTLTSAVLARGDHLHLKELRLAGLRRATDTFMASLGKAAPDLEVLDLSYARDIHNSSVEAFVSCDGDARGGSDAVLLSAREAGRDPTDPTKYWRRVTRLRHISLTSCLMLTDHACSHLAYAVPQLELLELAGIGSELRDDGLVRLLETTPYIRKVDLEDASDITDDVLEALTPVPAAGPRAAPPQPGHALEHLTISYAAQVTNAALSALVQACPRLRALEADNTRMSGALVKEFVGAARARGLADPLLVAVDCRGVGERAVDDVAGETRPRVGWRAWEAKRLAYLDARDEERLDVGQDECDAAREKRRKARRGGNASGSSAGDDSVVSAGRARWWAPSGRRSGGASPLLLDMNNEREGCTIM